MSSGYGDSRGEVKLKVRCELEVRIVHNKSRSVYEAYCDKISMFDYGDSPASARENLMKTIERFIQAEYEYGYLATMEEVRDGEIDLVIRDGEIILRDINGN